MKPYSHGFPMTYYMRGIGKSQKCALVTNWGSPGEICIICKTSQGFLMTCRIRCFFKSLKSVPGEAKWGGGGREMRNI